MTQVPGPSQRPVDTPVVPGDASAPDDPPTGQPAPGAVTQELAALLARTIDPDVWAAREEDQRCLGSKWDFKIRRINSEREASRILADTELLDALVAYRQQHRVIETRAQLAESPTGTVIRTSQGDTWLVDHGPHGEWVGGRTRIYCQEPNTELVFYPANFDLSLPVTVLWSPPAITERPTSE